MILRVLNFLVIGVLVLAAAWVYGIKYDSTVQAEWLAKLRGAVRHERDVNAALRAKLGELDSPARIEPLAKRFLQLKPVAPSQFDTLDHLPERPPQGNADPIASVIERSNGADASKDTAGTTGSIPKAPATGASGQ